MITSEAIRALLAQGENECLEFKANTPAPENLAKMLSSLANTKGGTVIVGVREPNEVLGTNIDRFSKFVERAKQHLHGSLDLNYYPLSFEGKTLGIIEVSSAKLPIATSQGYFKRVGERDTLLDAAQLAAEFSAVQNPAAAITALSETISAQSEQLEKLRLSFDKANSWVTKLTYMVVGAIITGVVRLALPGLIDVVSNLVPGSN